MGKRNAKAAKEKPPKEPPSAFALAFGQRLRDLRVAKDLTGTELGVKVGGTKSNVSQWENGTHLPDLETLAALCGALSCSADELLGLKPRLVTASAMEEARAYDELPPEQKAKWRAMRLTLFSPA